MTDLEIHDKPDIQSLEVQFQSVSDSSIEPFSSWSTLLRSFDEIEKFIKLVI